MITTKVNASSLQALHTQLIHAAQRWAMRMSFDAQTTDAARKQLICANHRHYWETIPAYRRLADSEGVGPDADLAAICRHCMMSDDIFKSYSPIWLDERRFNRMTDWLSELHHRRIALDLQGVDSVDAWVDRLATVGVRLVYSSGTSGNFSFIPRDEANWQLLKLANACYLPPLFLYDKVGNGWQRALIRLGVTLLAPPTMARLSAQLSTARYDGFFLDFRGGRTGMQSIGVELGPFFRRRVYLYDYVLTANALRSATRGPRTPAEHALVQELLQVTTVRKEENFAAFATELQRSIASRSPVFIFGAPFQLKELCAWMVQAGRQLTLPAGSLVLFGGGWKSFSGQRIPRHEWIALITEALGAPPRQIVEGYSMTEMNAFNVRCDHGRFHIPPLLEPVLLDDELNPLPPVTDGATVEAVFGFLDPFATAYPGFVITGDVVRLTTGACPCGLTGPAITQIERGHNRGVKGCGGVMTAISA